MSFFRKSELPGKKVLEGIILKSVSGNKTMMTFFDFEPGSVIPSHTHIHEQITFIIEGEIEMILEGESKVLKAGDGVVIKSNQEHGAKVLSRPSKAIDAWYPVREDYQ